MSLAGHTCKPRRHQPTTVVPCSTKDDNIELSCSQKLPLRWASQDEYVPGMLLEA